MTPVPVEVHEGGGVLLPGFGVSQNPGSRVVDVLEPVQGFASQPEQDSSSVVQSGCNERMNECLHHRVTEKGAESDYVFQVGKG